MYVEFRRPSYPVLDFLSKIIIFLRRRAGLTSPIGIATLCGFRRGRGLKPSFFTFLSGRGPGTTLCGFHRGRGAKTVVFFAFLSVRGQPSAGSRRVAVLKPSFLVLFSVGADNPLRVSALARCQNRRVFLRFLTYKRSPSAGFGVGAAQNRRVFAFLDIQT